MRSNLAGRSLVRRGWRAADCVDQRRVRWHVRVIRDSSSTELLYILLSTRFPDPAQIPRYLLLSGAGRTVSVREDDISFTVPGS